MTHLLVSVIQRLIRAGELPEREQEQIAMEVSTMLDATFPDTQPYNPPPNRIPGLGKGDIVIASDFDAPLDESFWLGNA